MADFSGYSTVLFIDSMVALEGKPLPLQPWADIDPKGPILVVAVPQVCTEIDKRKRDGRLGKRAREFNRLIGEAAISAKPVRIAEGPPQVDIAIAVCDRVNWDFLDDLDPDDPDARVVAQILNARGLAKESKLLLSQDVNPIAMASRHGLRTLRMSDDWLLDPEPSPNEKELAKLKARVNELESTEPDLHASVSFDVTPPIELFRVKPLEPIRRGELARHIISENPRQSQNVSPLMTHIYDSGYDARYQKYRMEVVPRHVETLHRKLETTYGQVPFRLALENSGRIQAENLVLSIRAVYGSLNDRFILHSVFGPTAPQPKPGLIMPTIHNLMREHIRQPVGRHEMELAIGPDRGDLIEVHCADFRHGRKWQLEGVVAIDPHSESPLKIVVTMSASNMRGARTRTFTLDYSVKEVGVEELIAPFGAGGWLVDFPMRGPWTAAFAREDYKWFDVVKDDEDDDD